jgi:hypothetical protein
MNQIEAASPLLSSPAPRRARLRAIPPGSRVAAALAARRAYGPPCTRILCGPSPRALNAAVYCRELPQVFANQIWRSQWK